MCSYSFVLIFAFILAFYVSTGNAIECYKCNHDTRNPDPNCVNVNEKTTKESIKDFHDFDVGRCLYTRKPEKDGAHAIERKAIFIPWVSSLLYCINYLRENKGDCKLCDTNLCNSMSGGPAAPPPTTSPSSTSPPVVASIEMTILGTHYLCYPRKV